MGGIHAGMVVLLGRFAGGLGAKPPANLAECPFYFPLVVVQKGGDRQEETLGRGGRLGLGAELPPLRNLRGLGFRKLGVRGRSRCHGAHLRHLFRMGYYSPTADTYKPPILRGRQARNILFAACTPHGISNIGQGR